MNLYEETVERQWFVRDLRDAHHRYTDEDEARAAAAEYDAVRHEGAAVVLYRDVTTGALTES